MAVGSVQLTIRSRQLAEKDPQRCSVQLSAVAGCDGVVGEAEYILGRYMDSTHYIFCADPTGGTSSSYYRGCAEWDGCRETDRTSTPETEHKQLQCT